jgi:hypothetical protein
VGVTFLDHGVPSHCEIRGKAYWLESVRAAQAPPDEVAATPAKVSAFSVMLLPAGVFFQRRPFQCSASGAAPSLCPNAPTAHALRAEVAVTPASHAVFTGCGARA